MYVYIYIYVCVWYDIHPAGPITHPWFQENDVLPIAACMFHVQNDHHKKSLNSDGSLTLIGFCVQKGCELKSRLFHSIASWRPVFERSWHVPISQRHCWILMYFHSFGFGLASRSGVASPWRSNCNVRYYPTPPHPNPIPMLSRSKYSRSGVAKPWRSNCNVGRSGVARPWRSNCNVSRSGVASPWRSNCNVRYYPTPPQPHPNPSTKRGPVNGPLAYTYTYTYTYTYIYICMYIYIYVCMYIYIYVIYIYDIHMRIYNLHTCIHAYVYIMYIHICVRYTNMHAYIYIYIYICDMRVYIYIYVDMIYVYIYIHDIRIFMIHIYIY